MILSKLVSQYGTYPEQIRYVLTGDWSQPGTQRRAFTEPQGKAWTGATVIAGCIPQRRVSFLIRVSLDLSILNISDLMTDDLFRMVAVYLYV